MKFLHTGDWHIGKPLRALEFIAKVSGARRDES